MNKRKATILLAFALSVLLVTGAYAAIGLYKTPTASQYVPATITYMLNTDANDTTSGWSVKIEIKPVLTGDTLGAAVRTMTFLSPAAETTKGSHSVTWDGNDDGGTPATPGTYRAVVTANAAPVTGTDLVPLWESPMTTTAVRDAAVNKNPDSPYYGYVYMLDSVTKKVYIFQPDGSTYTTSTATASNGWVSNAPWGIDIASDDSVWITTYSYAWLDKFDPLVTTRLWEAQPMGSAYRNPRFIAVQKTLSGIRIAETYWNAYPGTYKTFTWNGSDPPSGTFTENIVDWCLMEPEYDADGNLAVCAYADSGAATTGGALVRYGTDASVAFNSNIHRGCGLAYSPDGQYIWVSRFVDTGTATYNDADTTPIYRVLASTAFTTASVANGEVTQYGLQCAADSKRAYTLECDRVGNLVATTGVTNAIGAWDARNVGVYAPPDDGSTDSRVSANIVVQPDPPPYFVSANDGVQISMCSGVPSDVIVQASDESGCADIQKVYLDLTQFGGAQYTPMNRTACTGNDSTWTLGVTAPSTVAPGEYTLPVYLRDVHYPTVVETEGSVDVVVSGGFMSGQVTIDQAGWPVADVTVTATDGGNSYTTTTDADGNYIINAAPGSYTVTASDGTGFAEVADASTVTVACGQTLTGVDRKLAPVDVRTCTGGNYYQFPGRNIGEPVCVVGTIVRAPAIDGVQQGFDGYYYIYDTLYLGTVQAVKIVNWAGTPAQANLKEGDKVIVMGTWTFPNGGAGYYQGYVDPIVPPFVVSSDNPLPQPTAFSYDQRNYTYGRYYAASGKVKSVGTDRFNMEVPTSATDSTPVDFTIVIQSLASTGVTLPNVGDFVEMKGMLAYTDSFGQDVLTPGKASDVALWPSVDSLGAAEALPDGGVILNSAVPLVVTDGESSGSPGVLPQTWCFIEAPDRSSGIEVNLSGVNGVPEGSTIVTFWPGDTVTSLKGRLQKTNNGRELFLTELPTFTTGSVDNLPKPLAMTNVAAGGGWFGGNPPVADRGNGLNNQGLVVTVYGRVIQTETDPISMKVTTVFIDDGSAVQGAIAGDPPTVVPGLKVELGQALGFVGGPLELGYEYYYPSVGDYVAATGVLRSEWIADSSQPGGGYRIRVLKTRLCIDANYAQLPFYDQFVLY